MALHRDNRQGERMTTKEAMEQHRQNWTVWATTSTGGVKWTGRAMGMMDARDAAFHELCDLGYTDIHFTKSEENPALESTGVETLPVESTLGRLAAPVSRYLWDEAPQGAMFGATDEDGSQHGSHSWPMQSHCADYRQSLEARPAPERQNLPVSEVSSVETADDWLDAPPWAFWRAWDWTGSRFYSDTEPKADRITWNVPAWGRFQRTDGGDERPDWRDTLEARPSRKGAS